MKYPLTSGASHVFFTLMLVTTAYWSCPLAQTPAWALGEQPNFSGVIANWALADAIKSGEGLIYATNSSFFNYSDDPIDVGYGTIKPDGSFTFGLVKDAARSAATPSWSTNCPSLKQTNPALKIALVEELTVPQLYEEGVHARPYGNIAISTEPVTTSNIASRQNYTFIYADGRGSYKGSCSMTIEDYSMTIALDLDLRKGWNSVLITLNSGLRLTTAAIPKNAQWYLVNPITINDE